MQKQPLTKVRNCWMCRVRIFCD